MKVQVLIKETIAKSFERAITTETISRSFELEVVDTMENPLDFAINVAKEKYKNGDFILDGDAHVINRQITDSVSKKKTSNWAKKKEI